MMEVRAVTEEDIPRLVEITRDVYGSFVKTSNTDLEIWARIYMKTPLCGFFCTENGFIMGILQRMNHEREHRTIVHHLAVSRGRYKESVYLTRHLLEWTLNKGGMGVILSGRIDGSVDLGAISRCLGGKMVPTWLIGD